MTTTSIFKENSMSYRPITTAEHLGQYRQELIEQGFAEGEAWLLVREAHRHVINQSEGVWVRDPKKAEESPRCCYLHEYRPDRGDRKVSSEGCREGSNGR